MPIFKKDNWYYVRVRKHAAYWTPRKVGMHPTRWKTKKEAKAAEAELHQRIDRIETTQISMDLLTLCNEYLNDMETGKVSNNTFKTKKRFCEEIIKDLGNLPVEDLTPHKAQSYLLKRAKEVSSNSFNVYRQEGKRLFNWAFKQKLLPRTIDNPFEQIEKRKHDEKKKVQPAPIAHVVAAYMAADRMQKDLVLTYLITGARKSEILRLEWHDIDFKNKVYALRTHKSGTGEVKITHHDMPEPLYEVFMRRFEARHPLLPYVFWHGFWSSKTKKYREDRYISLSKFTKRLCKKAKVPEFGFHQLRHLGTAILKEEADMGLAKLQRFLRHDKQKTTEIYAGHLETGTKEQTDFLADFWSTKLTKEEKTTTNGTTEDKEKGAS